MRSLFLNTLFIILVGYNLQSQIIDKIVITNNHKTKYWIILRELIVKEGDTLSFDDTVTLNRCKENLYNTHLFNDIIFTDTLIDSKRTIIINVGERWYFWPYPVLEQSDGNFASFLRNENYSHLNYGVILTKHNFRGRKEDLSIKLRLGFRQQIALNYTAPMISENLDYIGYFFEIAQFRQKSFFYNIENRRYVYSTFDKYLFIENKLSTGLIFRPHLNTKHNLLYTLQNFNIKDSTVTSNPEFVGKTNSRTLWHTISYLLEYSSLDYNLYPTNGRALSLLISSALSTKQEHWEKVRISYQQHFPLAATFTYSSSYTTEYYPWAQPYIALYQNIIGSHYFRGYEDEVWQPQAMIGSRQQFMWNFLKKQKFYFEKIPAKKFNKPFLSLYFTTFVDGGTVWTKKPDKNHIFTAAFGCGLDIVSYYDLIFRIEGVINRDKKILYNLNIGTVF